MSRKALPTQGGLHPDVRKAVIWNATMGRLKMCEKCHSILNVNVKDCPICLFAELNQPYKLKNPRI